jgi:hypothetical protein
MKSGRNYFLYLCFCFVVVFLICEIIARHYLPEPRITLAERGSQFVQEYGVIAEELRGFSYPKKKSRQEKRVLFLGDSLFAGAPRDNQIMQKFSGLLDKRYGKGAFVTRIIATRGWGTDQELIAFRNLGLASEPEIVILGFCQWNDIADNLSYYHKPFFTLRDGALFLNKLNQKTEKIKHGFFFEKMRRLHYNLCKSSYYYYVANLFSAAKDHVPLEDERAYAKDEFGDLSLSSADGKGKTVAASAFLFPPVYPDEGKNIDNLASILAQISRYYAGEAPSIDTLTGRISHFTPFIISPRTFVDYAGERIDLTDYGYKLTAALIKQLRDDVESYGGKFYLLICPLANPFNWRSSNAKQGFLQKDGQTVMLDFSFQSKWLRDMCLKEGIRCIDFSEKMEQQYPQLSRLIGASSVLFDVHYGTEGNAFLNRQMYEYFVNCIAPEIKKE